MSGLSSTRLRMKSAPAALRAVELVRRQRQQIDVHRADVDRDLCRRPAPRRRAAARRARARSRRSRRAAGWTPISLLAAITLTSAVRSLTALASASRSTPVAVDGQTSCRRQPCFETPGSLEHGLVLDGRDDHVPAPPGGRRCQPHDAKLFDSGRAPLVKMISRGAAPMSAATSRRAASTASCARQPHWWLDEAGLPNVSVKYGSMTSSTRGSTGVVA